MFAASGISYSIDSARLLRDVSLTLSPGEVVAIIGPNGAGKSTFLKVLGGEIQPTDGIVSMEGRNLVSWGRQALARRRSIMPQSSKIAFPFSVFEIVMMGRSPHAVSEESEIDYDIVGAAMARTGVNNLALRNYNTLSGGEQKRVQLARALAQIWTGSKHTLKDSHSDRYLFLDEPVASMDPSHQHETLRIAREFSQHNVGVLIILHDINLAAMYADRIAVFNQGELVADGEAVAILDEHLMLEVFGIHVLVQRHPTLSCPLIVALPEEIAVRSDLITARQERLSEQARKSST
ncbi:MAG: heme ABC transporter ATP-binding protein [Gammaproteobacteria bacterium]|nr:heme ABC transporter ATP-binding protein [Gammaproteobacteria bacterium]